MNNTESVNHILKQATQWKCLKLVEFINKLKNVKNKTVLILLYL